MPQEYLSPMQQEYLKPTQQEYFATYANVKENVEKLQASQGSEPVNPVKTGTALSRNIRF